MATPYIDIFDYFMLVIDDYQLLELYQDDLANFKAYVTGFLVDAISDFIHYCKQDLSDRNDVTFTFNIDLTDEVIYILSYLMQKHWLNEQVSDTLQMKNLLNDHRGFKQHSQAQNLEKKQRYLSALEERTDYLIKNYGLNNNDWEEWATAWESGTFGS